jgi:hypothetical protein
MELNATDLLYQRIVMLEAACNEERDRADALSERMDALRAILIDPANQLEQTKIGYYIYRFDPETMHAIADALGFVKVVPPSTLAFSAVEELPQLD